MPTTEVKKPEWVTQMGDFNTMPHPYREVPASEFWAMFNTHGFGDSQEYRQVVLKIGSRRSYHSVHICWYYDVAYAITAYEQEHDWNKPSKHEAKFYRIGCVHEYHELSAQEARVLNVPHFGNCYHVYQCSKCKTVLSQDSSG